MYHVMSRGDHLEVIFRDSKDPELFLATLGEAWIAQRLKAGAPGYLANCLRNAGR
jgi:hypothetical protein